MARYRADHRETLQFLAGSLDGLLPEGSVARVIWAGLECLDFSQFEVRYCNDETGRSALNPRSLVAVWMLGMLRGVTSSVRLASVSGQDIEFRWLLGDAPVEKSTLSEFRKKHYEALVSLSGQVLRALGQHGLLPGEHLGVDGTIVRAASSRHSSKKRRQIERHKERLEGLIRAKLSESEGTADSQEVQPLQRRQQQLERALAQLAKRSDRVTVTEPDARFLRQKDGAYAPGYNAQVVTDLASGAILHAEVVEAGNDGAQLQPQVQKANAVLEQTNDGENTGVTSVVADGAYYNTRHLDALEQDGVVCYVPEDRLTNRQAPCVSPGYQASAFVYDADTDTMRCPLGQTLKPRKLNGGKTAMVYQAPAAACLQCPSKAQCCPQSKGGRSINRSLYPERLQCIAQRLATQTGQRHRHARWVVCEGAFARLIDRLHWRRCRTWGRRGAQAELVWRQLIHNLMLLTGIWKPMVAMSPLA